MDLSKYKSLYLQESGDHLSGVEKGLLELEKDPSKSATVDDLFRHYHSLKGMSASMGYSTIQKLAHAEEDLLDRVRSKKLSVSRAVTDTLLSCLDMLKELIRRVEKDEPLGEEAEIEPFLKMIKETIEGAATIQATPPPPPPPPTPPPSVQAPVQVPVQLPIQAPVPAPAQTPSVEVHPAPESAAPAPELRISNIMKVEGRVFDDLLSTAGDLFMSLSSFKTLSQELRSIEFKDGVFLLGKTVSKLHSNILTARMLPVADLIEGLPRIIRDMSSRSGKTVELKTEGTGISLDRSILENLSAPLVHIIRNSLDHGIETPGEREAAGKPPHGTISIKTFPRKDKVVISVSDDGRGIDIEKVKAKAAAKGVSLERLRTMTDKEAVMLVCLPGLSAAEKVTETSGRGVGMDVVKGAIEAMGGTLRIETSPGKGTAIIMELPKTTSIIKALTVKVSKELFLLPVSRIEKVIETAKDALAGSVFEYNGSNIPLIHLGRALGMEVDERRDSFTVIVVESEAAKEEGEGGKDGRLFGIVVDDFGDEIDAYIKPLTPPMQKLWGVSGIAIMGDGRPVLLVDLAQIIAKAGAGGGVGGGGGAGEDLLEH